MVFRLANAMATKSQKFWDRFYKYISILQIYFNFTNIFQFYISVSILHISFNFTYQFQFYISVSILHISFNFTYQFQFYKWISILQISFNFTNKFELYKSVSAEIYGQISNWILFQFLSKTFKCQTNIFSTAFEYYFSETQKYFFFLKRSFVKLIPVLKRGPFF
jgi:hypothetical protein